jgi:hypothetical protein
MAVHHHYHTSTVSYLNWLNPITTQQIKILTIHFDTRHILPCTRSSSTWSFPVSTFPTNILRFFLCPTCATHPYSSSNHYAISHKQYQIRFSFSTSSLIHQFRPSNRLRRKTELMPADITKRCQWWQTSRTVREAAPQLGWAPKRHERCVDARLCDCSLLVVPGSKHGGTTTETGTRAHTNFFMTCTISHYCMCHNTCCMHTWQGICHWYSNWTPASTVSKNNALDGQGTYKRDIEARSFCRRWKSVSITHSACVSVRSLGYPACNAHAPYYVMCGLVALPYFYTLSSQTALFSEKNYRT